MEIFGIVGAGIMGTDVAQLAAESGFNVVIHDIKKNKLDDSKRKIFRRLERYVKEKRISKDKSEEIKAKIFFHSDINQLADADIVLECVTEDMDAKKKVFQNLDKICKGGTVLASNTSSLSITSIAASTKRPESIIGIQFLMPARVIGIVELIPGISTTVETIELAKNYIKAMGKDYVISKDFPGFLLNRMLCIMINEAISLLHEGAGTAKSIDTIMKKGLNLPMGPLAIADMIGLDNILAVIESLYRGYSDPKYRPSPLLRQYVNAGYLGTKTGRGFHLY